MLAELIIIVMVWLIIIMNYLIEDGLNLEDLFGTLGNNGNGGTSSSNGLEYLDPF